METGFKKSFICVTSLKDNQILAVNWHLSVTGETMSEGKSDPKLSRLYGYLLISLLLVLILLRQKQARRRVARQQNIYRNRLY